MVGFEAKITFFLLIIASSQTLSHASLVNQQPEQIHLSYGANPSEMIVTWTTYDPIDVATVEFGVKKLDMKAEGTTTKFIDGGSEKREMFIHRVTMKNLLPKTSYVYHVGSSYGWSPIFWFSTMRNGSDWAPRLAVFGDMGNYNARALPKLQRDSQAGLYDVMVHVGDFAYDMDSDNARRGDNFMRQIEPIAAYTPYMVSVGNHEQAYNFSNYVSRFTMVDNRLGEINNHFFSFNIGPVHLISFSTEFYFFVEYGISQIFAQYDWLKKDLEEANKPENRLQRPWIITLGHRPMYCNEKGAPECRNRENVIRRGIEKYHAPGLEKLFYDHGVDLEIWAHEHLYERLWPIYDRKVRNGSVEHPYTNPGAPVHITTGSAGCPEELDPNIENPAEWSAKRINDYGFTRLVAHNKTHLHLEQISTDRNYEVVDEIWIIKDHHGYSSYRR